MEKERRTYKNGAITLVEYNGTFYDEQTDEKVVQVLDKFISNRNARLDLDTRIMFCLGDTDTGKDWEEDCDVVGYVGRSCGNIKIPILLYSKRSHGGCAILDNRIVKIEYANKKNGGVLYQHPLYHKTEDEHQETIVKARCPTKDCSGSTFISIPEDYLVLLECCICHNTSPAKEWLS